MTARSDARAAEALYRDPPDTYALGDRVLTSCGIGTVEHIAYSHSMQEPLYTVGIDPRIKLRLLRRDLQPMTRKA